MSLSKIGQRLLDFPNPEFFPIYVAGLSRENVVNMCLAENRLTVGMVEDKFKEIGTMTNGALTYSDFAGEPTLRKTMAEFLNKHFKGCCDSDDIVIVSGASSGLALLGVVLCDALSTVAIPAPFYFAFEKDFGALTPVNLHAMHGAEALSPASLQTAYETCESEGRRMSIIVITNPDNPTGKVIPGETIRKAAEWAARNGAHIILDEMYSLTVFREGETFQSGLEIWGKEGLPDNVHMVWGMSKDFCSSGVRCAAIITKNKQVRDAALSIGHFFMSGRPLQLQVAALLSDHEWIDKYLIRLRSDLLQACCLMERLLDERNIPHASPQGAFFMWCDLSKWAAIAGGELAFMDRLSKLPEGPVLICSGTACKAPKEGWFRLCFAACSNELLTEGVRRICCLLDRLESEAKA
ncbi:1-aminocyclopropane-1-carboxylate synthase 7 [Diplonema papillatum]|nr:1-aminocyclopropane-1-carboxylate synthase 7 [Diplonema papillatum]